MMVCERAPDWDPHTDDLTVENSLDLVLQISNWPNGKYDLFNAAKVALSVPEIGGRINK